MISTRSILPYLLLGAYSLMLTHALIPHQHDSDHSVSEHQHQHSHEHAHDHADTQKINLLYWLLDLIDTHQETSDESHHELVYTNSTIQQIVDVNVDMDLNSWTIIPLSPVTPTNDAPITFRPLHRCNSDPPDPNVRSYRGPPALG